MKIRDSAPIDKPRDQQNRANGAGSTEREAAGGPMTLIPWEDIWTSLRVARIRGNGEMIEVFYDTLFREAIFDDNGAWSLDPRKRS